MDPLSVTASIISVLQAANTVISFCYDFRASIKNYPWALTRITSSVNDLRLILSRLEQVANDSELSFDDTNVTRLTTLEALCKQGGAISNCFQELIVLEKKLVPGSWAGKDGSKRRALIQSIGWQFMEEDVRETLQRLEGYKRTLNIAITMDQTALTISLFKQFQDISLSQRKRSILQWLSPVDPSINHQASLKIRQAGTNDWFLSCKEFANWRESKSSLLWLSGFPGSGKTILMSTLIDFIQKDHDTKHQALLAYFYCDFRNPETRDPLNLAGSLLAQICFKIGSYPASLDSAFDRCKLSGSPYDKRISLGIITEIFLEITSERCVTVLVDGLDECEKRQDILDFFQKLGTKRSYLNVLISSRDETDIREALSDFQRIRLEAVSACLNDDIDLYINHRLSHDRKFKWLKESFQQIIRHCLSTKAKGMFRWVQCQLDQIAKLKTMKDIRRSLDNLPEGLQETYENILEKVDPVCADIVRQTLRWLVCDVPTMTLAQLYECLAIEGGIDHIDEEVQLSSPMDIYDLCGSLITATAEGEVILAHLSLKDYLFSDAVKNGKAFAFALSRDKANMENASKCLTYLSFAEFQTGPSQTMNDFEARLLAHPFLEHASKWWVSYVENAGSSSEELKAQVLEFFTPACRLQFMSWLQVICSEPEVRRQDLKRTSFERQKRGFNYYPKHATSLYYAASFGIEHVVKALLEQDTEVDATGGRLGATAFHAAALRGHIKIMDILFQKGADPNKMDFIKKTPMQSAVLGDHLEVISYLLDHGADPDMKDNRDRTPYDWACILGRTDAQKLLKAVTMVGEGENDAREYESKEYESDEAF
ncbi:hypothetical protein BKA64DRAFT_704576 [Cadophora sp. MPI-SDFR-AT-0126]|nr:hypothetical protein BKA64DRAFT_704576 [Leotiomycetes sp. MPI-SDFR-AT-0126]